MSTAGAVLAIVAAVAGFGVGALLLPRLLARLPDPVPGQAPGESDVAGGAAGAADGAAPAWSYAGLAATPGLPLRLGLLTAVVWALLAARLGWSADLPAFLVLGAVGVLLAWVDLRVRRLPDALTLPSYVLGGLLLGAAAVTAGDGGRWVTAWAGAAALFAGYLLLVLLHPAGMGFGDVKLSGVLGLHLTWLGWGHLAVGAFLGFLVGAVGGLVLIMTGRGSRKSTVPFGPSMLVGALLAVLWGTALLDAYWGR